LFWGEQPPLTPLGCGGRQFFAQEIVWEEQPPLNRGRTAGLNQQCGFLTLLVLTSVLASVLATVLADVLADVLAGSVRADAALGVFLRLEVLDFDRFFGFIPFLHD
jgi:hypothetical protein